MTFLSLFAAEALTWPTIYCELKTDEPVQGKFHAGYFLLISHKSIQTSLNVYTAPTQRSFILLCAKEE